MKLLYLIDTALWVVNGLTWALYAHSPFMAVVSFTAAVATGVFSRQLDYDIF